MNRRAEGPGSRLQWAGRLYLWHIGQPLQDGVNALEVVRHGDVGDAVVVHDLHAAQLVVGRVNLSAQDLLGHSTVSRVPPGRGPFLLNPACPRELSKTQMPRLHPGQLY